MATLTSEDATSSPSQTSTQATSPPAHEENATTIDIPGLDNSNQTLQESAQQWTDKALTFLSTASNETLGACLVGLGATTYVVLGRVGLVLMGVVGGVVLHATWEGHSGQPNIHARAVEERRRKEVGLDVAHRVLTWRMRAGKEELVEDEEPEKVEVVAKRKLDFADFKPNTASALNELTDAVIRDYVKWWYTPILPDELTFPNASRQMLVAFLLSISNHISRKRPADTFLNFLTNSSSIFIVFLTELSSAVTASPNVPAPQAVRAYLELKPESSLANVLDAKHQAKKLDLVAQDILESYLDDKALKCEPVRTFTQQVMAKLMIDMTIQSCSKAEFINGWIVYLLEDGEPELVKDIEAGLKGSDGSQPVKALAKEIEAMPAVADALDTEQKTQHKRTISKAQEAMDEALQEAQRLTQLMIEDDARRKREEQPESTSGAVSDINSSSAMESEPDLLAPNSMTTDDASESTTQGVATPTSSASDLTAEEGLSRTSTMARDETLAANNTSFTTFDQLGPQYKINADPDELEQVRKEIPALTLHKANVIIFDDTDPNDKMTLRQKPATDYLIQIEPASSHYPGWMIVRKYPDFETLHEVLRRIAAISGAAVFAQAHPTLPNYKAHTKSSLREALERYMTDAMRFPSLAESEGMKRFLEKERGLEKSPSGKSGFGWPTPGAFEKVGKGMMDVLTQAPKEVAGGGKSFIGGVSGVLGNKKKNSTPMSGSRTSTSMSTLPPKVDSTISQSSVARQSQDSLRNDLPVVNTQPTPIPPMERKPSTPIVSPIRARGGPTSSRSSSRPASNRESIDIVSVLGGDQIFTLPPPPSEMTEDYDPAAPAEGDRESFRSGQKQPRKSTSTLRSSIEATPQSPIMPKKKRLTREQPPLSEEETQMVVELLFATINELYSLSSAWTLRKTLLTAAKTFLLRPGNPQVESIRQLLQTTVLDANTSDEGIAAHLRKIRENSLPTEEELKAWPPELPDEEKENLRRKARKLLVERGMPQALTSVMGQAASGEALGKLFDCLQMPDIARGLIFGLALQGLRAITQ